MTYQVLAGALIGLGLFVLIRALIPTKPDTFGAVARIDALRQQQGSAPVVDQARRPAAWKSSG